MRLLRGWARGQAAWGLELDSVQPTPHPLVSFAKQPGWVHWWYARPTSSPPPCPPAPAPHPPWLAAGLPRRRASTMTRASGTASAAVGPRPRSAPPSGRGPTAAGSSGARGARGGRKQAGRPGCCTQAGARLLRALGTLWRGQAASNPPLLPACRAGPAASTQPRAARSATSSSGPRSQTSAADDPAGRECRECRSKSCAFQPRVAVKRSGTVCQRGLAERCGTEVLNVLIGSCFLCAMPCHGLCCNLRGF